MHCGTGKENQKKLASKAKDNEAKVTADMNEKYYSLADIARETGASVDVVRRAAVDRPYIKLDGRRLFTEPVKEEIQRELQKRKRPLRSTGPVPAAPLYSLSQIALHLAVPEEWVSPVLRGLRAYRVEQHEAGSGRPRALFSPEVLDKVARRLEIRRIKKHSALQDDAAAYWRALAALSVSTRDLKKLSGQLTKVAEALEEHRARLRKRPPSVVVPIHTLENENLKLVSPLGILVRPLRQAFWRASLPEAALETTAEGLEQAVLAARDLIEKEYLRLRDLDPRGKGRDSNRWKILRRLIRGV